MPYRFTPPTYRFRQGADSLFGRRWVDVGQSLLKTGASYKLYKYVGSAEIENADIAYLGGRSYIVSDAEATALSEAGYGNGLVYIGDLPVDSSYPFPGDTYFPGDDIYPFGVGPSAVLPLYPSASLFPGSDVTPEG